MERDAVIVEVGLNEATSRTANPSVPITPRECADDALRCHSTGAAIVHWHARDPATGEQRLDDAALYGEALDLAQIPDGLDVEWIAVPYGVDDPSLVEQLCRHALDRGGGVRLGVGDDPAAFPSATNAELVAKAARWAEDAGRPLASSADVRARFALG